MADHYLDRARIVEITRSWIGTPYHHQAALKGVGCDCLGLLRGVWSELYEREAEVPPAYTPDWAEKRVAADGKSIEPMLDAADRNLVKKDLKRLSPGDVMFIRVRPSSLVKHCGVISEVGDTLETTRIVHAYQGHHVREDEIHQNWLNKDLYVYGFPGIEE